MEKNKKIKKHHLKSSLKSRKAKRANDGNYDMTKSISLLLYQLVFKVNGLMIITHSVTSFLSV